MPVQISHRQAHEKNLTSTATPARRLRWGELDPTAKEASPVAAFVPVGLPISTIVLCLLGLIVACSSAKRPTSPETGALPAYTPIESAIFDDEFHSASLSGGAWSADQKFGDRVRLADAVVVARTKTASQQPSPAGQPDVVVAFLPLGNPLKGKAGSEPIRVTLAPNSPSYRLFRWRQPALLGKDVVLLYRRYLQGGEQTIHFRAEPNTVEVHAAVQQALSVQY